MGHHHNVGEGEDERRVVGEGVAGQDVPGRDGGGGAGSRAGGLLAAVPQLVHLEQGEAGHLAGQELGHLSRVLGGPDG